MKDIFVKQPTITIFYTTLTTFLNPRVFARMNNKVERREYLLIKIDRRAC
jgi:hypothetical protein